MAGPWGVAPQLPRSPRRCVLAAGAGAARAHAPRRADAATGLLLVAALALGVVLASDVYESGAGVDRLLFGSLIGLSDARPVADRGALVAGASSLDAALAPHAGWPAASTRRGARARRPRAAADRLLLAAVAVAVVVALDAVGALLVAVVLVVPAATVRLVTPTARAAARAPRRSPPPRASPALSLADALNVGPGPAHGGARRRRVRRRRARTAWRAAAA